MRSARARGRAAAVCVMLAAGACAHGRARPPGTLLPDARFDRYGPLATRTEMARRTLPPLVFLHDEPELSAADRATDGRAVDLAREELALYVPGGPPPERGWGLVVFVSPWEESTGPSRWRAPLDRHDLVFVSAAKAGNAAPVLGRRVPLALLAYENVRARYPVDPARVYLFGFSGGSRVAEIIAVGYPDVFRGVVLAAGSDPIGGETTIHLPPADLVPLLERTRFVYATGEHDDYNLQEDGRSRASLKEWCIFDVEVKVARKLAHRPTDERSLDAALDALDAPSRVDDGELRRCNERVQSELSAKVADAEAAIARGDRDGARARIEAIDSRFGGLAAARVVELAARLAELERR